MVPLVPPGPGATSASVIQSLYDAVLELQGGFEHVDTKATLALLYPADSYRGRVLFCDEINSLIHSTIVTGAYAWRRVDGSAL